MGISVAPALFFMSILCTDFMQIGWWIDSRDLKVQTNIAGCDAGSVVGSWVGLKKTFLPRVEI